MEEKYHVYDAHYDWLYTKNPYGRVGVRGRTYNASPYAKARTKAKRKQIRANTKHARRMKG